MNRDVMVGLDDPNLLTIRQVTRLLDISPPTLRKLVREGALPAPIRQGRHWVRYRAEDVRDYIERVKRSGGNVRT